MSSGTVVRPPAPAPESAAAPRGLSPAPPGAPTRPPPAPAAADGDSTPARLAAFVALAAFGAAHWAMLVEAAPAGRTLLVVLIAGACAGALTMLARLPERVPRGAVYAGAAALGLLALVLGLMAAGLEPRLLLPKHWTELGDGLDRGLGGIQGVEWPYNGPDEWIGRTILLGAPLLLTLAATAAFWPARRAAAPLRALGLLVLLLLYGTAVTEHDPGQPLLRGLVLLLLVAAWLWLPRMPAREAALGAAVVGCVGVLALPLAAGLDGERPWWDYRAWNLFGGGKTVSFDWSHQYGPLDWPRKGTTLLNVVADRPHYWKAQTLDTFDGLRWIRSRNNDNLDTGAEFPFKSRRFDPPWDYFEFNPRWNERITFTVRSLSSDLVVGAGLTYDIEGLAARPGADGTTRLLGDVLERGDSYTIEAYAPDPSADQMRLAQDGYADDLGKYTAIFLPAPGDSAIEGVGLSGDAAREQALLNRRPVYVPLRGDPESGDGPAGVRAVASSRYERMYELTRRLTAGEPTAYDAVKAIERHLQRSYVYQERVPTRELPLNGFLFQEKRGYCQQFSGAMALMLRMSGIPARVAAGFSPGSYNKDTKEYRVRDLDAHSWVEVWFTGIGWVPFDPTPAAAPAQSQSSAFATSAAAADAGEVRSRPGVAAERGTDTGTTPDEGGGGTSPLLGALALLVLGLAAAAALLATLRFRRLRSLGPRELAEAQLAELRRALERLGWKLPPSTTLLGLERRLGRFAGPASEAYAHALRAHRYDPRAPTAPSLSARRALRRELTRGSLAERLKGLVAIPPVGPRV
ncbi:MAG TPA: transglutaminase-like domain-containing protein [Thermoleophilaceae bacterium]|nr:transglutaminase-like domain-containing protein [Thermoleophilaceae bacterium]